MAMLILGADAHHLWQLAFMDFALAAACLSKFPKERILNFMSAEELGNWASRISEATKVKRNATF
ncbi:MAG: hypothetical protein WB586_16215 [Chthoniobacterales bacterium]